MYFSINCPKCNGENSTPIQTPTPQAGELHPIKCEHCGHGFVAQTHMTVEPFRMVEGVILLTNQWGMPSNAGVIQNAAKLILGLSHGSYESAEPEVLEALFASLVTEMDELQRRREEAREEDKKAFDMLRNLCANGTSCTPEVTPEVEK